MPCYEYRCPECGKTFDVVKPMDKVSEPETCECGVVAGRVYSMPMLNFWFIDPKEMNGEKEAIDAGMYE